MRCVSIIINT